MDFVVVGFGLGALIVLLGLGVRLWGPRPWPVEAERPLGAAGLARAVKAGRICRAGGAIVAASGVLILVATMVAVVGQAGDEVGDQVVLAAGLMALALVALWGIAFYNLRWLDPLMQRCTEWSERHWLALKHHRAQRRTRRQRRATARPRLVPRPTPPRETPRPEADRGWLPPLPLDDDDDWEDVAPEISSANGNGRADDVPSRRVAGR